MKGNKKKPMQPYTGSSNDNRECMSPHEAKENFEMGGIPSRSSKVALTLKDLGYSWQSTLPKPEEIPEVFKSAIVSSFKAILKLVEDHIADPVGNHGYKESFSERQHPIIREWIKEQIMQQMLSGSNLGALFDSTKNRPTPKHLIRRGFYVWNQFTIYGAIKPGFIWFSDANAASLMQGMLGFDVTGEDVKNDRRFYKIKKIPQKYLIDISNTLKKCHSIKGMRRQ